jgi:hypothetical protein
MKQQSTVVDYLMMHSITSLLVEKLGSICKKLYKIVEDAATEQTFISPDKTRATTHTQQTFTL